MVEAGLHHQGPKGDGGPLPSEPARGPPALVLPRREAETVVLVLRHPVARAAIPAVCDRLRALLEEDAVREVVCDLGSVGPVDLPLQPGGQPEQREQYGRVEEEGDPVDPVA